MSNIGTKACSNVFFQKRSEASKTNQRLSSREGAAEEMSIDRGRLFRIENGVAVPYPEEVLLMSDLYNCPELENYYCTECCPLGHDVPKVRGDGIDRITVEAMNAFGKMEDIGESLLEIAVSRNDVNVDQLEHVFEVLDEVCKITSELKMWARKNLG